MLRMHVAGHRPLDVDTHCFVSSCIPGCSAQHVAAAVTGGPQRAQLRVAADTPDTGMVECNIRQHHTQHAVRWHIHHTVPGPTLHRPGFFSTSAAVIPMAVRKELTAWVENGAAGV